LRFADSGDNVPVQRNDAEWEKYIVVKNENRTMKLEVRIPSVG